MAEKKCQQAIGGYKISTHSEGYKEVDETVLTFELRENQPKSVSFQDAKTVGAKKYPKEYISTKRILPKRRKTKTLNQSIEEETQFARSNLYPEIPEKSTSIDTLSPSAGNSTGEGSWRAKAHGRIKFQTDRKSGYTAPYICVDDKHNMKDLLDLMLENWQLPVPKLVVSVVGETENFRFPKHKAGTLLKQGLLDMATTSGAWILTKGYKTGLSKMIGSAIKEHFDQTFSPSRKQVVLIGIAHWNSITNKEKLVDSSGNGKFPAIYPVADVPRGSRANRRRGKNVIGPLDPNHSHFIIIDSESGNNRKEADKWRANFEKFLTTENAGENGIEIPLLTLLVNGGDGSLKSCADRVLARTPVVAVAGSGRAADLAIAICDICAGLEKGESLDESDLKKEYVKTMSKQPSHSAVDSMRVIADKYKYISVFDTKNLEGKSYDRGLHEAICSALFDWNYLSKYDKEAQVELARIWDCVEYAREKIFNKWDITDLDKSFQHMNIIEALANGQLSFVQLFLEHGLSLEEFVTKENLETLYKKGMHQKNVQSVFIERLFRSYHPNEKVDDGSDLLFHIGKMLADVLDCGYPNIYQFSTNENHGKKEDFNDPSKHLFLWAAIFNKMDLSKEFWRRSENNIAAAIMGYAASRGFSKKAVEKEEIDVVASYNASSMQFEKMANGLLDFCWSQDRQYTTELLVRECDNWGKTPILTRAYDVQMEEFVAQPACCNKLTRIWRGDISLVTHIALIILFALCPLTAFLMKFSCKESDKTHMDELDPTHHDDEHSTENTDDHPSKHPQLLGVTLLGRGANEISYPMAIYRGLCSPIVKAIHHSIWFISFLVIYALFMISKLDVYNLPTTLGNNTDTCDLPKCCTGKNVDCLEIWCYLYAFLIFQDDIRQVLLRFSGGLFKTINVVAYTSLLLAIILRFSIEDEEIFELVRWIYGFSYMAFVIRFTQILFVIKELGPKIIMIRKMFEDLLFFLIILALAIVIFGVVTQAILHPGAEICFDLLRQVVYKPFFQFHGEELFLGEYKGYRFLLLGFYLITTNILLLNLLIAMFSHTFEKVQENAEILWKYHYYAVVYEHTDRPYILLIGSIYQITKRYLGIATDSNFYKRLSPHKNEEISRFVKLCADKYLAKEDKKNSDVSRDTAAETCRLINRQFAELHDDVMERLDDRLKKFREEIEKDMEKSMKSLIESSSKKTDTILQLLQEKLCE